MQELDIDTLYGKTYIDVADWNFARTVQRLGKCSDPMVGVAAALVSRATADGHVCLDLGAIQWPNLYGNGSEDDVSICFENDQWLARLANCTSVGMPGDFCPLILNGQRLYLHRYWTYEQELARAILSRSATSATRQDERRLAEAVARLFPDADSDQRLAARLAVTRQFSVISGGPGTGKTYTIAKIILLLHDLFEEQPIKIFMAAPTGKAAARLEEAVEAALKDGSTKRNALPMLQSAQTLHRLLGYRPATAKFRYNAENPLPADAVIVDEASMIDLALMHQLVLALPRHTRLILVGDKDQLASVEAGAVLGDICYGVSQPTASQLNRREKSATPTKRGDGAHRSLAPRNIVVLGRSYRFEDQSGIDALGRAINAGDADKVLSLLTDDRLPAIAIRPLIAWDAFNQSLADEIRVSVAPVFECREPGAALQQLNRFKILTAVRKGPYGVDAMNHAVELSLRGQMYVPPATAAPWPWYPGRPIMITRNDYYHGLFNGDIGVTTGRPGGPANEMQVAFSDPGGGYKYLAPHQLAEHQTVYAMTIHKSQGSEFDRVMVVLPDKDLPLLTRELIYTAVTRARKSILIWADPHLLALAVQRPIQRSSGLREALWPS